MWENFYFMNKINYHLGVHTLDIIISKSIIMIYQHEYCK